jgi:hypothetical protein
MNEKKVNTTKKPNLLHGIRAGRLAFASVLYCVCDCGEFTLRARNTPRECRESYPGSSLSIACVARTSWSRVASAYVARLSSRVCREVRKSQSRVS